MKIAPLLKFEKKTFWGVSLGLMVVLVLLAYPPQHYETRILNFKEQKMEANSHKFVYVTEENKRHGEILSRNRQAISQEGEKTREPQKRVVNLK